MKHCPRCGTDKPVEQFGTNRRNADGRARYCKPCFRQISRAHYRKRADAEGRTVRRPVEVPAGQRRCPDCRRVLPLDEFPRNRGTRDGRGTYCKPCHNARGHASLARNGGARNYHLRRRYGLTAAEVDALLTAQGGLCAVCRARPAEHVDHDHTTGAVRGLLCFRCNGGLGNFGDDGELLLRAFDYLRGVQPGSFDALCWDLDPACLYGPEPQDDEAAGRTTHDG